MIPQCYKFNFPTWAVEHFYIQFDNSDSIFLWITHPLCYQVIALIFSEDLSMAFCLLL